MQPGLPDAAADPEGGAPEIRPDAEGSAVDTHCHLFLIEADTAEVVRSARGAGVERMVCVGIDADDMDAVAAWLRAHGVEVLGEPTERYGARGSGLSLYVLDPDGNLVELKQVPR